MSEESIWFQFQLDSFLPAPEKKGHIVGVLIGSQ